ncbi:MAG: hypothetical protein BVN35_12215 [Proteobacteria bacterium ST_bin11]|nr:MAG: hypothetical protein BVN35_12215 [Proteobacteria bacterium ST_bin11]
MEEILKNIAATVLGGFLGYFIRLFIEHRLAIDRIKENVRITEFNKAIGEFRGAFAPAIAKFQLLSDAKDIDQMLKEELIPQFIAIEKFRPFVSPNKKDAYQEAWEKYHQSHKKEGVSSVYFLDYAMGNEKDRMLLFKERINAILKFAE